MSLQKFKMPRLIDKQEAEPVKEEEKEEKKETKKKVKVTKGRRK